MLEWFQNIRSGPKIEGNYNFYIYHDNIELDSSSTLNITTYNNKDQQAVIPCSYQWFIIKNGLPRQITQFKGSTFICDPHYVGYYVQVHVVSNDNEYGGKAILTFSTVKLDVALKSELISTLSQGMLNMPIFVASSFEPSTRQCHLRLQQSQIRLSHAYSDTNYIFQYTISEPIIVVNPKQSTRLTIQFTQKYQSQLKNFQRKLFNRQTSPLSSRISFKSNSSSKEKKQPKLELIFSSRKNRDVFLFAIKSFIAKRQIKNSLILKKIENIGIDSDSQFDFNSVIFIEDLKHDVNRYDKMYKKVLDEKIRLEEKIKSIEKEKINSSNTTYPLNFQSPEKVMKHRLSSNFQKDNTIRLISSVHNKIEHSPNNQLQIQSQHYVSPFQKKKQEAQQKNLSNLLDQLNHSQIDDNQRFVDQLISDKKMLQMKLEKSQQQIDYFQRRQRDKNTQYMFNSKNNNNAINTSSINFTYGKSNSLKETQPLFLEQQNRKLREINQSLTIENKKLVDNAEGKSSTLNFHQNKIQNHLQKVRYETKNTDNYIELQKMQKKYESLEHQYCKKDQNICHIRQQNQTLKGEKIHLQKRLSEIQSEIAIMRRSQDSLNRSQNITSQMENYNEEQIEILKEHNNFLVSQNEKLVKACEKYMNDAKQSTKLRQQIITLRQKLNKIMTNPEANSFIV